MGPWSSVAVERSLVSASSHCLHRPVRSMNELADLLKALIAQYSGPSGVFQEVIESETTHEAFLLGFGCINVLAATILLLEMTLTDLATLSPDDISEACPLVPRHSIALLHTALHEVAHVTMPPLSPSPRKVELPWREHEESQPPVWPPESPRMHERQWRGMPEGSEASAAPATYEERQFAHHKPGGGYASRQPTRGDRRGPGNERRVFPQESPLSGEVAASSSASRRQARTPRVVKQPRTEFPLSYTAGRGGQTRLLYNGQPPPTPATNWFRK